MVELLYLDSPLKIVLDERYQPKNNRKTTHTKRHTQKAKTVDGIGLWKCKWKNQRKGLLSNVGKNQRKTNVKRRRSKRMTETYNYTHTNDKWG